DVVTGLITRITTPDGRASAFYYNHHSQLTSATGPDGLEMRRKYDEYGRLIQETAYSALFDHGLASKSDQRFASIRSTG
ncbi:RHS repeat domain-containing protein, partial [Escherichia coli]|uniref:RHS repeat domain-containing protein n=1 Tax=Escherichia coli TaxID=562 RepID=UPI00202CB5B2